jgi:hypothetical protein
MKGFSTIKRKMGLLSMSLVSGHKMAPLKPKQKI